MNEIQNKILEIESRNRKLKIVYILVGVLILLVFAVNNILRTREEKKKVHLLELERKDEERLNKKREDSIKKYVTKVNNELELIEKSNASKSIEKSISTVKTSIYNISKIVADTTIIRYYKRIADGNSVISTIDSINSPNFKINTKEVENDGGEFRVNAIYYGKDVKKNYVNLLKERLMNNNVKIKYVQPFESAKGYEWKSSSIEIGYKQNKEESVKLSLPDNRYCVSMYCYKPNERIREKIISYLNSKIEYDLTTYPDWDKKPTFFSSNPTIFYYDKSTKPKAESLKNQLNNELKAYGVKFTAEKGAGLAVSSEEKKDTFIIHYIDVLKNN